MTMIILRKRLLLDTDPAELARVKLILDKHQIEYHVKTTVSENANSRRFSSAAAARYVTDYSAAASQSYVYWLYVKRRDYARAKSLANGGG